MVILNCQRQLKKDMGRELESGEKIRLRDEPMWVVIHMYMEAMLGIFLYSYLYLKLAKNAMSLLLSLMFSFQQNQRIREWNRFCLETWWRWGWPKQCIHM
jgi:hypothetical protein